jgi:RNA polymerase sigma-70 factor (ECF subfamily)
MSDSAPIPVDPVDMDQEQCLADGLRLGDQEAFEHIVRTFGGRLLAVTRRILRDEEDARDAVQEALVSAFRARAQFSASAKVSTWLHRIAVNAALMKLRTRRRKPEESLEDLLPHFHTEGHHADQYSEWTEPVDIAMDRRATRQFVRDAIARLPETHRVVLMMRDIEGLNTEETAQALGLTPNAVKIRLHRARLALRTLVAPHFQGSMS